MWIKKALGSTFLMVSLFQIKTKCITGIGDISTINRVRNKNVQSHMTKKMWSFKTGDILKEVQIQFFMTGMKGTFLIQVNP